MQISAHHNLPVIRVQRQDPVNREALAYPPRPRMAPQMSPEQQLGGQVQDQARQRPPLFMQAQSDANLPRRGQQAMRTYQDVAMAGGREELVNRINEMA